MSKETHTPSKRNAAIYRKAAFFLEKNSGYGSEYSCDRIGEACGVWEWPRYKDSDSRRRRYHALRDTYAELFRPKGSNVYWGGRWGVDANDCRILALCFMAAITERP